MTFIATAQPTNVPPRIYLSVDGLGTSPTVTILRVDPDGKQRPVRTAEPAVPVAGAWQGYDYEAPFGQPVTYLAVPSLSSANLLTANQSSLETDTTGWAANDANTTLARTTAQAAVGTASLQITAVGAGTCQVTTPTGTAGMPVTAGETYTATARFRPATVIRQIGMSITWYDAAGAGVVGTVNATVINETLGVWTQLVVTGPAPAGAVYARIVPTVYSLAAAEVHYIDDLSLFPTYGQVQTTAPTNFLLDADYEAGMPAWTSGYFGVTPAIFAGGANGTAYSLGMTQTSTTNPQGVVHQAPVGLSLPANTVVRVGAWIKATAGNTILVNGNAYNPATTSSLGEVTGSQFVADGTWQYVTADFTWAGAAFRPGIVVRQRNGGGYTVGHTIQIDQAAAWTVASLAPLQLDVTDIWLIHPGIPDLSMSIPADDVGQIEARSRPARSALHQPLGRVPPVAITEARGAVQSGITVMVETYDRRDELVELLADGVPLLLNIPPALGWGVDPEWVLVGDVDDTPWNRGLSTRHLFTLPYTVVDRPVGGIAAQWTWQGVLGVYATWADVQAAYPTWSQELANAPITV